MSSNNSYNPYSSYISHLNALNPEPNTTELSQDELAAELDFWRNAQFAFDVPPGIGLLDDDFDVSPKTPKIKDDVTLNIPTNFQGFEFLPQLSLQQTQQVLSAGMTPFIAFATNTSTPIVTNLQPMVAIPSSTSANSPVTTANFPLIYPTNLSTSAVTLPGGVIGVRSNSNAPILPKPSTTKGKTEQKIAPAPSPSPSPSPSPAASNSSRKNSLAVAKSAGPTPRLNKKVTANSQSSLNTTSKSASSSKKSSTSKPPINDMNKAEKKDDEGGDDDDDDDDDDAEVEDENEENKKDHDPNNTAKLAAEEDKRRRNTAASARFRIKKKMREQALEHTAKEMTTKAELLEGRVKELEMEIKWLRSLIVEKDARLLDIERPGKRRKTDTTD
ncbi:hypothetical protein G9A89_013355 [Geosiphon pyriformis]|nr:hypothetical protein G9A89_013355 [Geosiphon pyriformis]